MLLGHIKFFPQSQAHCFFLLSGFHISESIWSQIEKAGFLFPPSAALAACFHSILAIGVYLCVVLCLGLIFILTLVAIIYPIAL
jgi:hypothetical protein